jgi:hypothetical protein
MSRLIICVVTLALSAGPTAQESVATDIILRVYNTADISNRDLDVARRVLSEIFLRAEGIGMTWQECGTAAASAPQCRQVLAPAELVIRVVGRPIVAPGPSVVFGYSYVDTATRSGTLATVLGDQVQDAAMRTHTDVGILLARVIAHEVGHLLLGSADHADQGVMRTRWSDAVRRRLIGSAEWSFSHDEAIALRRGLLARIAESAEYSVAQIP